MKECPKCHQILDASSFNKDGCKKDGLLKLKQNVKKSMEGKCILIGGKNMVNKKNLIKSLDVTNLYYASKIK
jgi:hypothetical protein